MWKLKIGEGANNPLLRSRNGFLGRETWEFDPDAGTPEELAECAKQNKVYTKLRVNDLKDSTEVTEEVLLTALRRVLDQYSSIQAQDGHWPGGYSGILFILPLMNEDGGWSTHTLGPSSMFGSCVNYVTLRLLGEVLDGDNYALSKGRDWILSHGSAKAAPQWAKLYLSSYGCFHIFFPFIQVLNMICCWIENPNSDAFRQHLPRINDFLWIAEDGMKSKVYVGCQSWDTALTVQAYCSTGLIQEFGGTIKKAHDFIKNAQVTKNCPSYKSFYRERSKASWTLSNGENGWSIADTTAECLKAVLLLSKIPPDHVGDPIKEERLYDAVDCLLSFVNKDGTLSSAECKRTTPLVEEFILGTAVK
uniref:Squalene cyclase N-terminal domain-containing protein n=1 Tax=Oryza punctata TaxID=4537 RepID=A0A0E0MEQ7_ORYPU